jgi:hypothetical protein
MLYSLNQLHYFSSELPVQSGLFQSAVTAARATTGSLSSMVGLTTNSIQIIVLGLTSTLPSIDLLAIKELKNSTKAIKIAVNSNFRINPIEELNSIMVALVNLTN